VVSVVAFGHPTWRHFGHPFSGRQYGLEHTLNLSPPSWRPVTNLPGVNGALSLPGLPLDASGFYRVNVGQS
jgi:hypothetical protein